MVRHKLVATVFAYCRILGVGTVDLNILYRMAKRTATAVARSYRTRDLNDIDGLDHIHGVGSPFLADGLWIRVRGRDA